MGEAGIVRRVHWSETTRPVLWEASNSSESLNRLTRVDVHPRTAIPIPRLVFMDHHVDAESGSKRCEEFRSRGPESAFPTSHRVIRVTEPIVVA